MSMHYLMHQFPSSFDDIYFYFLLSFCCHSLKCYQIHAVGMFNFYSRLWFSFSSVADPWHFGTDPYPRISTRTNGSGSGSFYFRQWDSRQQQKKCSKLFYTITFWRYTFYIIFQREKVIKKSQSSRNQGFIYFFCLIEGSGSMRPTNIRILPIRIRIRNTVFFSLSLSVI
jgi:hypothetical protein